MEKKYVNYKEKYSFCTREEFGPCCAFCDTPRPYQMPGTQQVLNKYLLECNTGWWASTCSRPHSWMAEVEADWTQPAGPILGHQLPQDTWLEKTGAAAASYWPVGALSTFPVCHSLKKTVIFTGDSVFMAFYLFAEITSFYLHLAFT